MGSAAINASTRIMKIDDSNIRSRYELLCRSSNAQPDNNPLILQLGNQLAELDDLILSDMMCLARRGSPDNFADILQNLMRELERFRAFCEFPHLEGKVVVGIGGAFSAGKSSLINALLNKKRLAVEVDPTTSVPTYLMHGAQDEIIALNIFQRRVNLTQEEFLSLTHEERERFGSQVGTLLSSAFICAPDFAWTNLALLDTPGYSKADNEDKSSRTDANVARSQLDSAQFIIWVVAIDDGTISEDDLQFLASLRHDIPRLVVLTRADKKTPNDVASIVQLVRRTLLERNLLFFDVIAVSTRKHGDYPVDQLNTYLEKWNTITRELAFAKNFKRQFFSYAHFIETEQRKANLRLHRLNKILALADAAEIVAEAEPLRQSTQIDIQQWKAMSDDLQGLRQRFFKALKQIGDVVGIPLPEPEDIDLIDVEPVDLLALLRALRQQQGLTEADYSLYWRPLSLPEKPMHLDQILRRTSSRYIPQLSALTQGGETTRLHEMLRHVPIQADISSLLK